MDARCILFLVLVCFITCSHNSGAPKFGQPISNLTVPMGREAILQCVVQDLATYKVAWLRVDTQTILTIHSHVITKNHRISVAHADGTSWFLKIRDVKESDRGFYMCQINTDPMKSQVGYLDVVVPPDILDYRTSTDMIIREGNNVTLRCAASGFPTPNITWRKEGGELIALNNGQEGNEVLIMTIECRTLVSSVEGPVLNITRVNRLHLGAYLCIASNGVPPSVSKRIMLIVHFPPIIWIQNQLVGTHLDESVALECHLEAYPKSVNFWTRDSGEVISQGTKYDTALLDNGYKTLMRLVIKEVTSNDFGAYRCVAKNSLGDTDGTVKLYEIPRPTTISRTTVTTTTTTTTTIPTTTTTTQLPTSTQETRPQSRRKPSKFDTNANKIPARSEKPAAASESSQSKKTAKVATIESGLVSSVLHSSSSNRGLFFTNDAVAAASFTSFVRLIECLFTTSILYFL